MGARHQFTLDHNGFHLSIANGVIPFFIVGFLLLWQRLIRQKKDKSKESLVFWN